MKKTVCMIFALILLISFAGVTTLAANRESENNDDFSKADILSVNEAITGNISNGDDSDWFKFTLSKSGHVNITLEHENLATTSSYWQVALYKEDGTTDVLGEGRSTAWTVKGNENLNSCAVGLDKGTYYAKVMPYGRHTYNTSEYKLTINYKASDLWETENNSAYTTADIINVNTEYSGSISSSVDEDWFRFTLESDGAADISFTHPIMASTTRYWEMYLLQSDGTTGITDNETMWQITENADLKTCMIGLKKGTYYIKVVPYSRNNVDSSTYKIKVGFEASDLWEKESNNGYLKANPIPLNEEINGSMCGGSDVDWYSFTLEKAQTVTIGFSHPVIAKASAFWKMRILSSNGTDGVIGSECFEYIIGNEDLSLPPVTLGKGTYYIAISTYSNYTYSADVYTLTLSASDAEDTEIEPDGNINSAYQLVIGKEITGSLFNNNDVDFYKFVLDSESEVTLVFTRKNENETSVNVACYESNGTTRVGNSTDFRGNAAISSVNYGKLPKGTYYIRIEPYSSYYNALEPYGITVLLDHVHTCGESWEITKEPDCTREGEQQNVCTVCGAVVKEAVPATGHTYGEWTESYAPECEYTGYRTRKCINCSHSESEDIPALGHNYGEWTVTKRPTCTSEGIEESVCSNCGNTKRHYLEMTEHIYGESERIKGSIFSYPMIYSKKCIECGRTETFEDNKYRWAAPVIIGGGILIVVFIVILIIVKIRKNIKEYNASNAVPVYPVNTQVQSAVPRSSAPAVVPFANNTEEKNVDENGNIICECGKTNKPDAKFCCNCGKKLR